MSPRDAGAVTVARCGRAALTHLTHSSRASPGGLLAGRSPTAPEGGVTPGLQVEQLGVTCPGSHSCSAQTQGGDGACTHASLTPR